MLPAVAAADGGAFAAYRDGSTVADVRFDEAGAVVRELDLGVTKAAYPLRLVRISEDVYFVAYRSRTSPVDLSAP